MYKVPLETRLQCLAEGHFSDPSCVQYIIKNMADTPISVYLYGYGDELNWLMATLDIPDGQRETLTYQDVAKGISKLTDKPAIAEAVRVLAQPFYHYFEERMAQYDEKNPT